MDVNPFTVLNLSPAATDAQIQQRLQEGLESAKDAAEQEQYRHAAAELSDPLRRLIYSLLLMPTISEPAKFWNSFIEAWQENPLSPYLAGTPEETALRFEQADIAALLNLEVKPEIAVPDLLQLVWQTLNPPSEAMTCGWDEVF